MEPIYPEYKESTEIELPNPETYQAVCYAVWDLGVQEGGQYGPKRKVKFAWELNERINDKRRFSIYQDYNNVLSENSRLYKDLSSWRGMPLSRDEMMQFDITKLIGVNCMISVIHNKNEKSGKTYANLGTISGLMRGLQPITPENTTEVPKWVMSIQEKSSTFLGFRTNENSSMETMPPPPEDDCPF